MQQICKVPGCQRPCEARGLCVRHYARQRRGETDLSPNRLPTIKPFSKAQAFARVSKSRTSNGCLEWEGRRNRQGYGLLVAAGKTYLAHRVALELTGITIAGVCVLHHCDNPRCVEVLHLYTGTRTKNAEDRIHRQRSARGRQLPQSKLKEESVREIRQSPESEAVLADRYGVSRSAIGRVKRGESWIHVS